MKEIHIFAIRANNGDGIRTGIYSEHACVSIERDSIRPEGPIIATSNIGFCTTIDCGPGGWVGGWVGCKASVAGRKRVTETA